MTGTDRTSTDRTGWSGSGPRGAGTRTEPGRGPWPASNGSTARGDWSAGGSAGKGPVRGYPPAPGQPPPMYPPGQFAAWNRGFESQGGPPSQAGPPGREQANRGFQVPPAGQDSPSAQAGRLAAQRAESGSRYYDDSGAEPAYSVLAVSDPAADVTSTQTWQAVSDGRSTGTWTAPTRPGAPPDGRPAPPRPGPEPVTPGPERTERTSHVGDSPEREERPGRSHSGAHSAPLAAAGSQPDKRTERGSTADGTHPRGNRPASGSRTKSARRPARRKRPASVKLAISVALLLVLTAAATLAYTVLRAGGKPNPGAAATGQPKVTSSASQSPSLGPYGHIGSRQSDPQPLTVAQLFPASFPIGGQLVTRTASAISRRCNGAVTGSNIQSAVSAGRCDQAVRATYLARSLGLMGTVGVLNLSTAARAARAVRAADASDYIAQLTGKRGPTRRIGNGTGIEEALAKGHYLILVWAEFTSLRRPRTAGQRTRIVTFMTELVQGTANVSLANRMLGGTP